MIKFVLFSISAGLIEIVSFSLLNELTGWSYWPCYLIALIFRQGIVNVFANGDMELASLTTTAMTYITLHYLVSFVNIIGTSFHTAIERPLESAIIALCRSVVFVLIPLFALSPLIGQMAIWLSMPIAETLTLFVSIPLMATSMKRLRKKM